MPVFPAEVGKGLAEQCAVSDFDMPWSAFAVASLAPSSPKASEAERTHVRTERHDFLQAATCSASSLLTPQCQELSIGGEDLRHRLLELPPSDRWACHNDGVSVQVTRAGRREESRGRRGAGVSAAAIGWQ
jgi:hypothetical protein